MNPMSSQYSKLLDLGSMGVAKQMRSRQSLDQVQCMGRAVPRTVCPRSIPLSGRPLPGITCMGCLWEVPTSHQRLIQLELSQLVRMRAYDPRLLIPCINHEWIHLEWFCLSVRVHTAWRVQGWEDQHLRRTSA